MKFLINEVYKKTKTGGKGLCRVFLISDTCTNGFKDITKRIAELCNNERGYNGVNLTIHYGSGTGYRYIEHVIKVHRGKDVEVINVSIFNP